ncbi:MAG TPA: hypothetical protein VGD26_09495, partial [Chitinophagaceae bacterium]
MKHQLTCFFLLLISLPVFSQVKWDLRRAVDYAVANNITIRLADLRTKTASLNYQQSKLDQYPSLNFQSNLGYRF